MKPRTKPNPALVKAWQREARKHFKGKLLRRISRNLATHLDKSWPPGQFDDASSVVMTCRWSNTPEGYKAWEQLHLFLCHSSRCSPLVKEYLNGGGVTHRKFTPGVMAITDEVIEVKVKP